MVGDGDKVKFVPSTGKTRFTLLNSGEGDILFRNTTETMSRDTDLKLTFLPVNYYDGQGFPGAQGPGRRLGHAAGRGVRVHPDRPPPRN